MTYVGVSAQSSVQKPFSALGGRVNLEARGFAKPFGGRIGPWYGRAWPPGAAFSDSTQKTDPLLPSRDPAQGGVPPASGNEDLINHSRFPGDTLGMGSMAALSSMKGNLNTSGSAFYVVSATITLGIVETLNKAETAWLEMQEIPLFNAPLKLQLCSRISLTPITTRLNLFTLRITSMPTPQIVGP